jgi:CubicO group peptidase (beta-lactamase class C family)
MLQYQKTMDKLNALFTNLKEEKHYVGLSLLINQTGQTIFRDSLGYQSRKTKRPIQDDTLFYLYSMNKALTGTLGYDPMEDRRRIKQILYR